MVTIGWKRAELGIAIRNPEVWAKKLRSQYLINKASFVLEDFSAPHSQSFISK
jgi:hypothetical protein